MAAKPNTNIETDINFGIGVSYRFSEDWSVGYEFQNEREINGWAIFSHRQWMGNGFYTGPTWSKVWFPSGQINSNQLGWMLNFDSSFRYRPADFSGADTDGSATGLGFDHVDAMVTFEIGRASCRERVSPYV